MKNTSSDGKNNNIYYTPTPLKKMTKAKISDDNNTIPNRLKNIIDKDTGMIPIQIDQATIPIVSSSLYNDYTACPREYMANEARQVRKAIEIREKLLKKAKTKQEKDQILKDYKAELWVSLDGFSRKLIIEGKNSMGMSITEFDQIYRVIGHSGNFKGSESGQFGIGALSYLCLSDTLLFETWSRETGEKYILESKDGYAFEILPTEISTLKTYGTKCTITINPDINIGDLLVYIKQIGRFLRCPVYLQTTGNINTTYDVEPNTTQKLGHIDFKDHLLDRLNVKHEDDYSYINIDNDDYELHGMIIDHDINALSPLLLLGIPIKDDRINTLPNFLINIKNERKYKPTSSRDGFSVQTITTIKNRLTEDLKNFFINIKFNTLDDIRNSPYKLLLTKNLKMDGRVAFNTRRLNDFVNFEETCPNLCSLTDLLNQKVSVYTSDTTPFFGKSKRMSLFDVIRLNKKILYNTKHISLAIYSVLNNDPDIVVVITSKQPEPTHIDLLNKYKIEHIYDYIHNNNIIIPKKRTDLGVYTYNIVGDKKLTPPHNMTNNYIKIPRKHKLQQFLRNIEGYDNIAQDYIFDGLFFCKETSKLDNTKAVSFNDIKNTLKDTLFNTSDGVINGIQICKKYDYKSLILIHNTTTKDAKKYKNVITFEKCKKATHADLVIFIDDATNKHIQYLLLYIFNNYTYNDASNNNDLIRRILKTSDNEILLKILNMSAVEDLGVDLNGSWYDNPNKAHKYLNKIKTMALRKLYARFVCENGSWVKTTNYDLVDYRSMSKTLPETFNTLDKYYTSNSEKYKTDDDIYFDLLSRKRSHQINNKGDKTVTPWLVSTVIDEIFYPNVTKNWFNGTYSNQTLEFHISHIKKQQKLLDEMYKRKIILNKLKINYDFENQQTFITFSANKLKKMDIDSNSLLYVVLWATSIDRYKIYDDAIKSKYLDNTIHLTLPY